jgi:glucan endo-1,3-beta-D-glucosidase
MTASSSPTKATNSIGSAVLSSPHEPPHLIIQIDKTDPNKALGVSYFGHISSSFSTLFNFDVPISYAGKTCAVVFLFPNNEPPWLALYILSGTGGIDIYQLTEPATDNSTYNNVSSGSLVGSVATLTPGYRYVVTTGLCAAGKRVGYKVDATGTLDLEFFEVMIPGQGLFIEVL